MAMIKRFCKANDRAQVADNLWRIYKSDDGRYFMRINDSHFVPYTDYKDMRVSVWSSRGGSDYAIDCTPAVYVADGVEYCFCAYRGKSVKFTADSYNDVEMF